MQNFHFLGFLYYTTIRTLTKVDCMLRAMFSGKLEVLTGESSETFVRFDDCQLTHLILLPMATSHTHRC